MGVDRGVGWPTEIMLRAKRGAAALACLMATGGCSGGPPSGSGANVDAGVAHPDAATNYGYGVATPDAASCPSASASACNTIANLGVPVPTTCSADPPPRMTGGGAIADGTYVLTAQVVYNSPCGAPLGDALAQTLEIAAGCAQSVTGVGDDAGHATVALASEGSELTLGQVCPASAQGTYSYTATATTLTLSTLDPTGYVLVSTYTRQ